MEATVGIGLRGIALTGYGMEHDVEHAKKVGFVCHLIKPVHIESLEEALNVFIRMCDKPLKRGLGRSASGYCFV
ncbi:MAG: hypothetical protein ABSE48_03445 [Verrucomicrobiota bacterium]